MGTNSNRKMTKGKSSFQIINEANNSNLNILGCNQTKPTKFSSIPDIINYKSSFYNCNLLNNFPSVANVIQGNINQSVSPSFLTLNNSNFYYTKPQKFANDFCNLESSGVNNTSRFLKSVDLKSKEQFPFLQNQYDSLMPSFGNLEQAYHNKNHYLIDFILNNENRAELLLEKATYDYAKSLFDLLKPHISIVLEQSNYFSQKLIKLLSQHDRMLIWELTKPNLDYLLTHKYAHHCYKLLIDLSVDTEQTEIFWIIKPHFMRLISDPKGTHIIQKLLDNLKDSLKSELTNYIHSNFLQIVFNKHGVCLIKRFIQNLKGKCTNNSVMLSLIFNNFSHMINHVSAHYALLCLIDELESKEYEEILDSLSLNIIEYSVQIYSSRIIEKILKSGDKVRPIYLIISMQLIS